MNFTRKKRTVIMLAVFTFMISLNTLNNWIGGDFSFLKKEQLLLRHRLIVTFAPLLNIPNYREYAIQSQYLEHYYKKQLGDEFKLENFTYLLKNFSFSPLYNKKILGINKRQAEVYLKGLELCLEFFNCHQGKLSPVFSDFLYAILQFKLRENTGRKLDSYQQQRFIGLSQYLNSIHKTELYMALMDKNLTATVFGIITKHLFYPTKENSTLIKEKVTSSYKDKIIQRVLKYPQTYFTSLKLLLESHDDDFKITWLNRIRELEDSAFSDFAPLCYIQEDLDIWKESEKIIKEKENALNLKLFCEKIKMRKVGHR